MAEWTPPLKIVALRKKPFAKNTIMIQRYRILLVEDDAAIREGLTDSLLMSGYEVIPAEDGKVAMDLIYREEFDLALLDIVLPHHSGLEILEKIREDRPTIPVMMLTAKGAETDKVKGLKSGADDYVVKPFGIMEVLARIEALLRRSPERPRVLGKTELDGGCIDFENRVILLNGESIPMTTKEYELARHLASHAGRVITKEEILTRVWQVDPRMVETRSVDTTLARLRDKMGEANHGKIKTLRGRGYIWED